jgi:hypothetical protein
LFGVQKARRDKLVPAYMTEANVRILCLGCSKRTGGFRPNSVLRDVRVSAYFGTVGYGSKPQGSRTEFNRQIGADLGEIPLVAEATSAVRSGGLTIPLAVRDRLQRAWLGRNSGRMAEMFLAPDSVNRIRSVVERGAENPYRAGADLHADGGGDSPTLTRERSGDGFKIDEKLGRCW